VLPRTAPREIIDPVIPKALNGLQAEVELSGRTVHIIYRIGNSGYGLTAVTLNGRSCPSPARPMPIGRGAEAPVAAVLERLTVGTHELVTCPR
jgi:1,2-beta-oligoglucan phosphorylase